MEAIEKFLGNIFSMYPESVDLILLKKEIYAKMKESYINALENGKSKNEAMGLVISNYSNINEEIEKKLVIETTNQYKDNKDNSALTLFEVNNYLKTKTICGLIIAIAFALCIISPIITSIFENFILINCKFEIFVEVVPFIIIGIAAIMIVIAGIKIDSIKSIEKIKHLTSDITYELNCKYKNFQKYFVPSAMISIIFFVLAPIMLILFGKISDDLGFYSLLICIAIGVFLFIFIGNIREGYKKLLKISNK